LKPKAGTTADDASKVLSVRAGFESNKGT